MFNQGPKNQSNQNPSIQSFLETLRQQSSGNQPSSPDTPTFPAFERFQERKRLEEQRKAEFFQTRKKEFHEVYSLKKRQEENRIEQIHGKLKKLAKSMRKLKKEVDVAVSQNISTENSGIRQESFLDHLSQMIDLLKRQVDSSQTWLHLFNQRSKKKSHYWNQVKKSGSSFMLSGERNVATSVG